MNILRGQTTLPQNRRLEIIAGDLTTEHVDAIVNAANAYLTHGGGVAGAIARRGGPVIQQESDAWVRTHGPVSHAHPAVTSAGSLPCRYVIHAVGPVYGEGDEDRKLADAVLGSLAQADVLQLELIAFPAISTGIFGFPKERAVPIFLRAFQDYFNAHPASTIQRVRITLMDPDMLALFLHALPTDTGDNRGSSAH